MPGQRWLLIRFMEGVAIVRYRTHVLGIVITQVIYQVINQVITQVNITLTSILTSIIPKTVLLYFLIINRSSGNYKYGYSGANQSQNLIATSC